MPSKVAQNLLPLEVFRHLLGARVASSQTLTYLRDFFYSFMPQNRALTMGQNELLRRAVEEARWAPEVLTYIDDQLQTHGIELEKDFEAFFWRDSSLEHDLRTSVGKLARKLGMLGSITWNKTPKGETYSYGGISDPIGNYRWSDPELRRYAKEYPDWAVGKLQARVEFDLPGVVDFSVGLFAKDETPAGRAYWGQVRSLVLFAENYPTVSGLADAVTNAQLFIEDLA